MTEREVLEAVKDSVGAAMTALQEWLGGSYYADEAHVHLCRAMQTLEAGIRYWDDPQPMCAGPGEGWVWV